MNRNINSRSFTSSSFSFSSFQLHSVLRLRFNTTTGKRWHAPHWYNARIEFISHSRSKIRERHGTPLIKKKTVAVACHLPSGDEMLHPVRHTQNKIRNGEDDYDDDSIRQHSEVEKGSKGSRRKENSMNCVQTRKIFFLIS